MPLDEVKRFRQLGSKTPGHPELTHAPSGVETTTGPLGQGVANAVGMAISAKMAEARFNTTEHTIFDHHIVCLAGDGCMQEGVAMEAIAFAGHQKLDNLILIYDSNAVTLDAMASETQSEDTAKRFEAIGFDVQTVDGHDLDAFYAAFERAKAAGSGKPQLIIAKTLIGKGIPEVAGTQKAHGEGGAKFADAARKGLGLPDAPYYVSPEVQRLLRRAQADANAGYEAWHEDVQGLASEEPGARRRARHLPRIAAHAGQGHRQEDAADRRAVGGHPRVPGVDQDRDAQGRPGRAPAARRQAAAPDRRQRRSVRLDAQLHRRSQGGRRRLHARPPHRPQHPLRHPRARHVRHPERHRLPRHLPPERRDVPRLRRLLPRRRSASPRSATCRSIYIFTHDSVGVGEDGPTHEPVETIPGLRVIPNLDVIRPADPEETAGAFAAALDRTDGPTLLALTRQAVPLLSEIPVATRREGALKGGYIARKETGALKLILLSAGSELQHALEGRRNASAAARASSACPASRASIANQRSTARRCCPRPAASASRSRPRSPPPGHGYVGLDGITLGIDRFGMSAPGGEIMKELGMTAEHVVEAAKTLG